MEDQTSEVSEEDINQIENLVDNWLKKDEPSKKPLGPSQSDNKPMEKHSRLIDAEFNLTELYKNFE